MNWKIIAGIAALVGLGATAVSKAETAPSRSVRKLRDEIRSHFDVSADCTIVYKGDPEDAAAFWVRFRSYLRAMIDLYSKTWNIEEPAVEGVAAYVALAIFPECDQTKDPTLSFRAVMAAMEFRISQLLEEGEGP